MIVNNLQLRQPMLALRLMSTLTMLINKLATCWATLAEVMLWVLVAIIHSSLIIKQQPVQVLLLNVTGQHLGTPPLTIPISSMEHLLEAQNMPTISFKISGLIIS